LTQDFKEVNRCGKSLSTSLPLLL